MAANPEIRNAADLGLTIEGVNHLTLPVRDHERARAFYVDLLGGQIVMEPNWARVYEGRSNSTALGVRICEGADLDLFYQPFGMAQPDQEHPHYAFYVQSAEELDIFRERLEASGTPTALITRQTPAPRAGGSCRVELHFNDPDGNHLQIDCRSYPFGERVGVGEIDPWDVHYSWRDWPRRG